MHKWTSLFQLDEGFGEEPQQLKMCGIWCNRAWTDRGFVLGAAYRGESQTGGNCAKLPKSITETPPKGWSSLAVACLSRRSTHANIRWPIIDISSIIKYDLSFM